MRIDYTVWYTIHIRGLFFGVEEKENEETLLQIQTRASRYFWGTYYRAIS